MIHSQSNSSSDLNLEHNDGLGDWLKEREKLEYSWAKTSVVLIGLLAVILIVIYALFNAGKRIFSDSDQPVVAPQTTVDVSINKSRISDIESPPNSITPASTPAPQEAVSIPIPTPKQTISTPKSSSTKAQKKKSPATAYRFRVVTGTFRQKANALLQTRQLKKQGIDSFIRPITLPAGDNTFKIMYRVQAGAFKSRKKAQAFIKKLKKKNIDAFITHT